MGLTSGTLPVQRCITLGQLPDEEAITKGLQAFPFRKFQDGLEEERLGFVDWRNHLRDVEPHTFVMERWAIFTLRIDTRKVAASTLKAHVDLRLRMLMKDQGLAFIGKDARLALQDEVKAELLPKQTPATKLVECAWDLKTGDLYTTATSPALRAKLATGMLKAFRVELKVMGPLEMAAHVCPQVSTDRLLALDPLDLAPGSGKLPLADSEGLSLGQDFFLWLWWRALTQEGGTGASDDQTALWLDDQLELAGEGGNVQHVTLKKGHPFHAREAFQLLRSGMRPGKFKLLLVSGDLEWAFSLEPAGLAITGMKMPPCTGKNDEERIHDRLFLLEEISAHLKNRWTAFMAWRMTPEAQGELMAWTVSTLEKSLSELEPAC